VGDVRTLPFETLDRFLVLSSGPPEPSVLVDLAWIESHPRDASRNAFDEIERLALRAFRLCTDSDEWIWAWDAPEEYSDQLYRFWPHRAASDGSWLVTLYPDGDDQVFVSQNFDWGVYAHFQCSPLDFWALRVFGKRLLDALTGHWPTGWAKTVV
jgi:hypothetical protein